MKYLKKTLKIFLILIIILVLGIVSLWVYNRHQLKYVCKPQLQKITSNFITEVLTNDYENIKSKSVFKNREHFEKIKQNITKKYSLTILGVEMFSIECILTFDNGYTYWIATRAHEDFGPLIINCKETSRYRIGAIANYSNHREIE